MRVEDLYHTNITCPVGTRDGRIAAVMMIGKQRSIWTFVLMQWMKGEEQFVSLWQYDAQERSIGPVCRKHHDMVINWLQQFGRVFEETDYGKVQITESNDGERTDDGEIVLSGEEGEIAAKEAAIFYMEQDIFGMTCHTGGKEEFAGEHYNGEFTLKLQGRHIDAGMLGICIDDTRIEDRHYMAYCSESMYKLKRTTSRYVAVEWGQPFQLMEFIVKMSDPELEVQIEDYDSQKVGKDFLGVMRLENIRLGAEEEIYIGDVTVTRNIDMRGEVPAEFRLWETHGAYMWTKVAAETLYEAYQKVREELECAAGILNLLVKNDSFVPLYSRNHEMMGWHYPFHENVIYTGCGIYLENCATAENLYYGGKDGRKNVIHLEDSVRRYLEDDNELDTMFNLFADGQKHQAFSLMLHWFEAGCASEDLEEKIVYLDMALEFAMNGERGASFLESRGMDETEQKGLIEQFSEVLKQAGLEENLQREIGGQIENTLMKNTNFLSKLERFIETEKVAVSPQELELIRKMRRKRNAIAHGKRNVRFSGREVEEVTGVISNILLAKVYKVVRENEHN